MRINPLSLLVVSTIVFTFLSVVLGEYFDMYERVPWWDLFLHFKAGWGLSIIGSYVVLKYTDIRNPLGAAFIAGAGSMTCGMQWEIFEFLMDNQFGLNMQKSPEDTMEDLIADSIGAVIGSIAAYRICIGHRRGVILNYLNTMTRRQT